MAEPRYEYRVTLRTKSKRAVVMHDGINDYQTARDLAVLERADYPHATIWIEQREIHDWERVAEL